MSETTNASEKKQSSPTTEERVKKLIVSQMSVEPEKIVPTATFVDDFNADSLDVVELIMKVEEEFDIEIPDEQAEKLLTVEDVVKFIDEHQ